MQCKEWGHLEAQQLVHVARLRPTTTRMPFCLAGFFHHPFSLLLVRMSKNKTYRFSNYKRATCNYNAVAAVVRTPERVAFHNVQEGDCHKWVDEPQKPLSVSLARTATYDRNRTVVALIVNENLLRSEILCFCNGNHHTIHNAQWRSLAHLLTTVRETGTWTVFIWE